MGIRNLLPFLRRNFNLKHVVTPIPNGFWKEYIPIVDAPSVLGIHSIANFRDASLKSNNRFFKPSAFISNIPTDQLFLCIDGRLPNPRKLSCYTRRFQSFDEKEYTPNESKCVDNSEWVNTDQVNVHVFPPRIKLVQGLYEGESIAGALALSTFNGKKGIVISTDSDTLPIASNWNYDKKYLFLHAPNWGIDFESFTKKHFFEHVKVDSWNSWLCNRTPMNPHNKTILVTRNNIELWDVDLLVQVLNISHEAFQTFCVLCGTDFVNPLANPKNALELAKIYSTGGEELFLKDLFERGGRFKQYGQDFKYAKSMFLPSFGILFKDCLI